MALGLGLVVAAVAAVAAFNAMEAGSQPDVLAPATVAPVAGLCTQQLERDVGGDVSPLFCSNGEINTLAWNLIATDEPEVMTLGRHPKPADVRAAAARDMKGHMGGPEECSALILSAAYYGWNFHIDAVGTLPLDCPILR